MALLSYSPKRVVVTGMGIESPIGRTLKQVDDALRAGRSGIVFSEEYCDMGFSSQVCGRVQNFEPTERFSKRELRHMGVGRVIPLGISAAISALEDSGLAFGRLENPRAGIIVGTGGPSTLDQVIASEKIKENAKKVKEKRRATSRVIGPTNVTPCMSSGFLANVSTSLKTRGVNYSVTSACATSAHCIGLAARHIALGEQDIMIAGGADDCSWTLAEGFDAMGALSTQYNDEPEKASRAFDAHRDGFVDAEGAGILILESLEHALRRDAYIYAEIVGFGLTSDGEDMVQPSGLGAKRCMENALSGTEKSRVTYINPHGTSTPIGDPIEGRAIKSVFGEKTPRLSSTKSMTGHTLGAAGATEAIYSLLMMVGNYVAPSINVDALDPECAGLRIVTAFEEKDHDVVLSNSFGFGGTNASLAFAKFED